MNTDNITEQTQENDLEEGAVEFLEGIIEKMGFDAFVSEVRYSDDGRDISVEIEGPDSGRLIGRQGQTLDALQLLLSRTVDSAGERRRRVSVDVEGYRQRRDRELEKIAAEMAKEAVEYGRTVHMDPMTARERRIVHICLRDSGEVQTESAGTGEDRHVCIIPL